MTISLKLPIPKYLSAFLLIFIIVSPGVLASSPRLLNGKGPPSIQVPKNWRYAPLTLGLRNVLMQPKKIKKKTSVSFTLTGFGEFELDSKRLDEDQDSYKKGRLAWAKKKKAKPLEFFKYSSVKVDGASAHQIGWRYHKKEKDFVEFSIFIECDKNFIHAKMLSEEKLPRAKEHLEIVLSGFKCN